MSDIFNSLLFAGDKNKGEYISIDQVVKYEGEACINDQAVPDKKNQVVKDCTSIQKKNNIFIPEEKRVTEAIE